MNSQASNLFLLMICIINVVKAESECLFEDKTWGSEGQLVILPQVSFEQCVNELLHNEEGKALTYYRSNKINRLQDLCIIFGNLDGDRSCTDCTSIKVDDSNICGCNNIDGECQIEDGNFIGGRSATSEFQCWLNCVSNKACNWYTWYSLDNEDISNECFLLKSCQTNNQCNGGCYSGQVYCDERTTITPDTTTTKGISYNRFALILNT